MLRVYAPGFDAPDEPLAIDEVLEELDRADPSAHRGPEVGPLLGLSPDADPGPGTRACAALRLRTVAAKRFKKVETAAAAIW